MPTEAELLGLPYFAILALGAHSARKAEPLFRLWKDAGEEHLQALADAIRAVEDLAACADANAREPFWNPARNAALRAAGAASAADCASAPASALLAADSAAELANAIDPTCGRRVAARAVVRSMEACASAMQQNGADQGPFLENMRQSVERLRVHTAAQDWSEEAGIAASVLDA